MLGRVRVRVCVALAAALLASSAAAADSVYLQVPGLVGPSTSVRHPGWFDVTHDTLVLTPGAFSQERSAVTARCTASVRTRLGAAAAAVVRLVGFSLGTVTLDRIGPVDPLPVQRAALRNAVLTTHSMVFEGGVAYDVLALTFDALELTTYPRNADGSLGAAAQGSFDCLAVR